MADPEFYDAGEVDELLAGKQDKLSQSQLTSIDDVQNKFAKTGGVLKGPIIFNKYGIGLIAGGGEAAFVGYGSDLKTINHYVAIPVSLTDVKKPNDILALVSNIADATKLTPVYGEWTFSGSGADFYKWECVEVEERGGKWGVTFYASGHSPQDESEFTYATRAEAEKVNEWHGTRFYITATRVIVGYTTANDEYLSAQTADDITKVAEAASKYKLNDADTNGVKDRAINTTTASEIEIPSDFTDLILKVSGAVTKLTMTGITSAYGDDLPTEGNNLITVTRIAEGAVFVKVVAMEDNSYAGA